MSLAALVVTIIATAVAEFRGHHVLSSSLGIVLSLVGLVIGYNAVMNMDTL